MVAPPVPRERYETNYIEGVKRAGKKGREKESRKEGEREGEKREKVRETRQRKKKKG